MRLAAFGAVAALAACAASCSWIVRTRMPETRCYYVAPDGADDNRGSWRRPFATLGAARDAARRRGPDEPRCIVLKAGDYFLDEPLTLDERDSGLSIAPDDDAEVTLYGGRRLSGWRPDGEGFWAVDLPAVKAGNWDFRMLAVNGRFAQRARLPRKGFLTHLSEFKVPWMNTTGGGWKRKPTAAELTTMRVRPGDLPPSLDLRSAELTVYHMWDESIVGLKALDRETGTLTFSTPAGHPPGAFGVKKYVVWNVREGLTDPGQWYLDRGAGKIVYWPLPGEDMLDAVAIAPTVESIIRLRGKVYAPVKDVTVRGIRLSVTNTPLKAGGFGAGKFAGAIDVVNSDACRLLDLEVVRVGGQGIKAESSRRLAVERCHIHHTGACGVKVNGPEVAVADCHIHHVGVTYPSAIGLWGRGRHERGVTFAHNHVHDTPYTAIAASGDRHTIEANLIERAMQTLHDGAGIYITFCRKVVVRGNFIRDIADTGGYGASAYYVDEQAEGCLVEGNLALRVKRPSHNHMARRNTVRNNVFVVTGDATLTFPKSSDYTFERNVIRATGAITFTHPAAVTGFAGNVLFSGTGKVVGPELRDGSILAEPKLIEFETGKVRFAADSPAHRLGIEPIDVSGAGPRQ